MSFKEFLPLDSVIILLIEADQFAHFGRGYLGKIKAA